MISVAVNQEKTEARLSITPDPENPATVTTDMLIAALKDDDVRVRSCAARTLGWIGATQAVDVLIDAIDDADISNFAIISLGSIGDERAVPVPGTEDVAALCAPDQVVAGAAEKHVVMVGANQLVAMLVGDQDDALRIRPADPRPRSRQPAP